MMYKLLEDRFEYKAGITVYSSRGYDYGCADDDTRYLGELHVSVTAEEDGGYPFFTVPYKHLEKIDGSN